MLSNAPKLCILSFMSLSMDDLEKTAQLAHLVLDDQHKQHYLTQLNDILDQVETLNQLDLDAVEPMTTVIEQDHYVRDDNPVKPDDLFLDKNAPYWEDNAFRVPKIV